MRNDYWLNYDLEEEAEELRKFNHELLDAIEYACEHIPVLEDLARLVNYNKADDAFEAFNKLYKIAEGGGEDG